MGGAVREVPLGMVFGTEVFMASGREEHEPRGRHAVVALAEGVVDEGCEVGLEGIEAVRAGVGFVAAEEGEDHVGCGAHEFKAVFTHRGFVGDVVGPGDRRGPGEPLIGRAKVGASQPLGGIEFIAIHRQVADHETALGKAALEKHLQPAGVLHRLSHTATDDADVVAFL